MIQAHPAAANHVRSVTENMQRRNEHYVGRSKQQCGSTPGVSTENAIHSLLNVARRTNSKRCLAAFIDIKETLTSFDDAEFIRITSYRLPQKLYMSWSRATSGKESDTPQAHKRSYPLHATGMPVTIRSWPMGVECGYDKSTGQHGSA